MGIADTRDAALRILAYLCKVQRCRLRQSRKAAAKAARVATHVFNAIEHRAADKLERKLLVNAILSMKFSNEERELAQRQVQVFHPNVMFSTNHAVRGRINRLPSHSWRR